MEVTAGARMKLKNLEPSLLQELKEGQSSLRSDAHIIKIIFVASSHDDFAALLQPEL
jgi:hypothetical protein